MGVLEVIAVIVVGIILVMTIISEPVVSYQFGKAMMKSGVKFTQMVVSVAGTAVKSINTTANNSTVVGT